MAGFVDFLGLTGGPKRLKLSPPSPSPSPPPRADTVMAAERAEKDHEALLKRRRQATVMGDYGALNVQTQKLGT